MTKKIAVTFWIVLSSIIINAQVDNTIDDWENSLSSDIVTQPSESWTGKVGIGTLSPDYKLTINDNNLQNGAVRITNQSNKNLIFGINCVGGGYNWHTRSGDAVINWTDNTGDPSSPGLVIGGHEWSGFRLDYEKGIVVNSGADAVGIVDAYSMNDRDGMVSFYGGAYPESNRIFSGGTYTQTIVEGAPDIYTNETNFVVYADGLVRAREIRVDLSTAWPDYVFEKNYNLLSLEDIKEFIDQNHHLPDVPSAAEISQKGINIGNMNEILLKKIEELTLLLIEQKERIDELESK